MIFFFIALLAGILTVLAPCIFPILPIIIGSSQSDERHISKRAVVVIASLSLSVIIFTLLLKASTVFIAVPATFWSISSGTVILLVGLAILFPLLWSRIPFLHKITELSTTVMGTGFQQKSYAGDLLIGMALGPVFTTCSPTYLFIVATILPAGLFAGLAYLFGFVLGLALSLLLIAYFGGQLVKKISRHMDATTRIKRFFGLVIALVGIAIMTGYDKKLETKILEAGYGATINFEETLLKRFAPKQKKTQESITMKKLTTPNTLETITLAGGCFWCTEANFQEQPGVIDAVSGYAGGSEQDASYLKVARGITAHREAVQISYDTAVISTEEILDIYWSHIDPTDKRGQFADKGFQYTTAIFYHTDDQKVVALDSKKRLESSGLFNEPVATEVIAFESFFPAEEYHQDYYKKAKDHYELYKKGSGRADFIEDNWAKSAAIDFLESEDTARK